MAWNPSPEVAAARDFGKKFGWDEVIVLHLNTKTGRMGYASYGETVKLCAETRKLADVAIKAVFDHLEKGGLR